MKQKPTVINLIIFIMFTVVVWIAFSIYSAVSRPTTTEVPPEALENFDARLDDETLSKLQQSIYLSENEIADSASVVTPPQDESEEEIVEEIEEAADEEDADLENEIPADEDTEVQQP